MEKGERSNSDSLTERSTTIRSLENAIEQLTTLESTIEKETWDQEQTENIMMLGELDFIKALDAIVYSAIIDNNLWDVKEIIQNIKYGFGELKCTQLDCWNEAIMCQEINSNYPAELFCNIHSKSVDPSRGNLHNFEAGLKKDIEALESMEKMLLILQEQMEYIKSKDAVIDIIAYNRVKMQINAEYDDFTTNLNDMMMKAKFSQ